MARGTPALSSTSQPAARLHDAVALSVVPLFLIAVYLVSGPRTLPDADAGELAAVAVAGGIPHPPGYPLLTVILQAFARLSGLLGLIPALTLSSVLAAAAAAALLCRTLLDRGRPAFDAALSTLAVFLSCNVWRAATTFEPFALNLLQAAALLWACNRLALASAERDSPTPPLVIGVCFGLGVCNHHSLAMLAPLPLAVVWPVRRLWIRRGAWMLLGFALGLAPLSFFAWLRTQPGWVWGVWDPVLPQLVHHLLRRDYGTLTLAGDDSGSWVDGPARMLATLPGVLSVVFFLCLALGCVAAVRGRLRPPHDAHHDPFAFGLLASFVTSGLGLPALFRLTDTPLSNLIVDRFFALPMLLLAFPIATGLTMLRGPRGSVRLALGATLLALHVAAQWESAERVHHRFFEAHVRNAFGLIEHDAVLMTVSDAGYAGGLYGKYVLHHPDVVMIASGLNFPWYRDRIARTLGFELGAPRADAAPRSKVPTRPLYLLEVPKVTLGPEPPSYPVGSLLRVIDANTRMPNAHQLFTSNAEIFARLRLPTREEVLRADAWEADVLLEYRNNWDGLGRRLEQEGDARAAAQAFRYRDLFASPKGAER